MNNNPENVRLEEARTSKTPGLGQPHQTGWTGVVAKLIDLCGRLDEEQFLKGGKSGAFAKSEVSETEGPRIKVVGAD